MSALAGSLRQWNYIKTEVYALLKDSDPKGGIPGRCSLYTLTDEVIAEVSCEQEKRCLSQAAARGVIGCS